MAFKIAVVGIGKIARDQHIPCILKNRNFKLAAGVSRHGTIEDVPCFHSISELQKSKLAIDAVALCTPPSVRLAMARECLDAGWHVLIEKPPTPTVGELLSMEAYARKKRRVLYATWHSRYNKSVDEAKARLKGKTVNFLYVNWKEDVNKWHPGQQWIWEPGGFGVLDPGINAISIVTKILPEPIFVEQATIEVPSNSATPIAAEIRFKRVTGLRPISPPAWIGARPRARPGKSKWARRMASGSTSPRVAPCWPSTARSCARRNCMSMKTSTPSLPAC